MRSDEQRGFDITARLIVTDYDAASRAIEQAWLDAGYDYDAIDMDMLHLAAEAVASDRDWQEYAQYKRLKGELENPTGTFENYARVSPIDSPGKRRTWRDKGWDVWFRPLWGKD